MKRTLTLAFVVTLAAVVLGPASALAQRPPGPMRAPSPTVSPYLNLLRRGTLPAVNYYGLVRPELEMRNNFQMLQRQVYANQANINELSTGADPNMPVTGKSVMFMNTGGYFMTFNPAGGSGTGFNTLGGGSTLPGAGMGGGMGMGMGRGTGMAPRTPTAPTRPVTPR